MLLMKMVKKKQLYFYLFYVEIHTKEFKDP